MPYLWKPIKTNVHPGSNAYGSIVVYECQKCGSTTTRLTNYCPDCGTKQVTECTCFNCKFSEVLPYSCVDGTEQAICFCKRKRNCEIKKLDDTCKWAKQD